MLSVYFNYPNSAITIHGTPNCPHIRQQRKEAQRVIKITRATLSADLQRFKSREYKFAAIAAANDLWVKIDLSDSDLEFAVAKHIQREFAKYYKRFSDTPIKTHC